MKKRPPNDTDLCTGKSVCVCVRLCQDLIKLQSDQRTHLDLRLSLFQAYPSSLDCSLQPLYDLHLINTSCFQCLTTNTQRLIKDSWGNGIDLYRWSSWGGFYSDKHWDHYKTTDTKPLRSVLKRAKAQKWSKAVLCRSKSLGLSLPWGK